jgi:hypothetical protein
MGYVPGLGSVLFISYPISFSNDKKIVSEIVSASIPISGFSKSY